MKKVIFLAFALLTAFPIFCAESASEKQSILKPEPSLLAKVKDNLSWKVPAIAGGTVAVASTAYGLWQVITMLVYAMQYVENTPTLASKNHFNVANDLLKRYFDAKKRNKAVFFDENHTLFSNPKFQQAYYRTGLSIRIRNIAAAILALSLLYFAGKTIHDKYGTQLKEYASSLQNHLNRYLHFCKNPFQTKPTLMEKPV